MNFIRLFSQVNSKVSKDRAYLIIMCISILALIIDTSINQIYYLNINEAPEIIKIIVFIVIGIVAVSGQYASLQYLKTKSTDLRKVNIFHIKILHRIVSVAQFILAVIFLIMVIQMIFVSAYSIQALIFSIAITYFIGISIMILLASKFFSWFRSDKNIVVIFYGISFAIIASNMVFASIIAIDFLLTKPDIIHPHFGLEYPYSDLGMFTDLFFYGYNASYIAGFITAWISTVLLLQQFSFRWKGRAHWAILSIPLVYFLIQFQPLFVKIFSDIVESEPVSFGILRILIITYSKPIGGLIFGAAFWTITMNLHRKNITIDYALCSAYGFVLLFISNQVIVLSTASYPPFGLSSIDFLGLSCYMLLVGLFSCAISVSQNSKLRHEIKKLVENKSNMLESIGRSEMMRLLQYETVQLYNKLQDELKTETGASPLLTTNEVREYCNEVMEEIEKSRSSSNKHKI